MYRLTQLRKTVLFLLSIMVILALSLIFWGIWKEYYNAYIIQPFYRKGIWLLVLIYAVILYLFTKVYGGFKIGSYRLAHVIYSQSLAVLFTNVVTYFQISLLLRGLFDVMPIVLMTIFDVVVITILAFVSDKIYYMLCPPREILVVYGNEGFDKLIKKLISRQDRYKVCESVNVNIPYSILLKKISEYQSVVLCYIDAKKRNKILKYCFENNIRTYMTPKISDIIIRGAEEINLFDTPLILCKNYGLSLEEKFSKRCLDILLSSLGIVLLSPLMALVAIAVKCYDNGSILFKQKRLTENGRTFYVYKFRSMIANAEKDGEAVLATKNDNRVTPVGKIIRLTRLDELPQLFNIFKGEMSIVGPRPERPEIAKIYEENLPEFKLRLKVKAGLTGYAQVYGKYNTLPQDKLKMDLMYIEQYSFLLDIKIILTTVKILFFKESSEGFEKTIIFKKEPAKEMKPKIKHRGVFYEE